ncbi:hypothetical protein Pmar_PMAR021056 [Perkinsus marinus ATCC 50983]|uniref:Uncharacterized protein n=1 Tax=Perkinsus marinus (strain ATCC 50983 / TXsc) TaxID=423536 RepID=C5KGA2_PERM5|nr:hypothetical protein Pmar_PMAR021056 [Perkinsus marinus ATCC 50983]EER16458.1 hypothetical protein Pmar_PMAR021056 [Perkinsus marinus ATCC 50983]|eukprot:XP_002784662.1 hypothetical protein Pmar_PMAR021056 [Perkinsus marinus ATCC 50983]
MTVLVQTIYLHQIDDINNASLEFQEKSVTFSREVSILDGLNEKGLAMKCQWDELCQAAREVALDLEVNVDLDTAYYRHHRRLRNDDGVDTTSGGPEKLETRGGPPPSVAVYNGRSDHPL